MDCRATVMSNSHRVETRQSCLVGGVNGAGAATRDVYSVFIVLPRKQESLHASSLKMRAVAICAENAPRHKRRIQLAVAGITLCTSKLHTHTHTHTQTHTRLTTLCPGLPGVSRYQKGKTNLARENEWQWHQLDSMQVCTSLQTDNHASTPPLSFLEAGCHSCRSTNGGG